MLGGLAVVYAVVLMASLAASVDVVLVPAELVAKGLVTAHVATALQQANIVQSIGSLKDGSATIPLQVSGSLTSLDQIGKVTVTPALPGRAPTPVRVDQLGTVQLVSVPADTITRPNGKLSIGLRIVKGPKPDRGTVAE